MYLDTPQSKRIFPTTYSVFIVCSEVHTYVPTYVHIVNHHVCILIHMSMYAMKFALCSEMLCYREVEERCHEAFHHLFNVSTERHRLHNVRLSSIYSSLCVCIQWDLSIMDTLEP